MKKTLKSYFSSTHTPLSNEHKERLFLMITSKKNTTSRWSFIHARAKLLIFAVTLCILASGALLRYSSPGSQREISNIENGLVSLDRLDTGNMALANNIGDILHIDGDVELYHKGQISDATYLRHADKILLASDAEIIFSVRDGLQAKIIGPAEFEVLESSHNLLTTQYTINMIRGTYVKLESIPTDEDTHQQNNTGDEIGEIHQKSIEEEKHKSYNVIVKTAEIEVATTTSNTHENIDIEIHDTGEKQLIHNTGNTVTITRTIENEQVIASVDKGDIASVDQQVLVQNTEDMTDESYEELAQSIKNGDLTIAYTIIEESENTNNNIESKDPDTLYALAETEDDASLTIGDIAETDTEETVIISDATTDMNTGEESAQVIVAIAKNTETKNTGPSPLSEEKDTALADTTSEKEKMDEQINVNETDVNTKKEENRNEAESEIVYDIEIQKGKQVLSSQQLATLSNNISYGVVMRDTQSLALHSYNKKQSSKNVALSNIARGLSNISGSLNMGIAINSSSPQTLSKNVASITSRLNTNTYTPPQYIRNLSLLQTRLGVSTRVSSLTREHACVDISCIATQELKLSPSQQRVLGI